MATKICKWCGKEYEACHTIFNGNFYRWQDVACCVEHGALYFDEVARDRGEVLPKNIAEIADKAKSDVKKIAVTTKNKNETGKKGK